MQISLLYELATVRHATNQAFLQMCRVALPVLLKKSLLIYSIPTRVSHPALRVLSVLLALGSLDLASESYDCFAQGSVRVWYFYRYAYVFDFYQSLSILVRWSAFSLNIYH